MELVSYKSTLHVNIQVANNLCDFCQFIILNSDNNYSIFCSRWGQAALKIAIFKTFHMVFKPTYCTKRMYVLWRKLYHKRHLPTSSTMLKRPHSVFKQLRNLWISQHLWGTIQKPWWMCRVWYRTVHDVICWTNIISFWSKGKCSRACVIWNASSSASPWWGLWRNKLRLILYYINLSHSKLC